MAAVELNPAGSSQAASAFLHGPSSSAAAGTDNVPTAAG